MDSPRLVQVIYGEGAGKTTMALGKAIRAHGNGLKVAVVQFMKSGTAWWLDNGSVVGDVVSLKELGIEVFSYGREEFVHEPIPMDYELAEEAWNRITQLEPDVDVLILDEMLNAISFGLIQEKDFLEYLDTVKGTELIITGRLLSNKIKSKADQVTRVVSEIHPFEKGVKSRKGFEY